ncbi:MAG: efflux RND transporter periplasmic adaptor subunit [Betaproteobacteria bacterium]|nr:efflux RND transporter periplasmic adaptor subunit [Betaproteobacteria bacterium]MBU6512182.1 efflux RND transporter periplasmic adaptor subunit [Betaproteobacteria bacterium]MDE1954541.1 efflux RND transporter periplasmic adaptor subunit [Betaproteobacteria bacterium]MDE2151920.1 efflux RND transporter periplasmic adaptor subunit [Betaproteobacteria bacterium]MDE2478444.1 efflux RND transporter periplasmic adaptor subunit [Betaproteobacteria bacterium]
MALRKPLLVALLILLIAGAGGAWFVSRGRRAAPAELTLYGNVDLRQVQLAFDAVGRIRELPVQEGQRVRGGQVLARLDDARLRDALGRARAALQARREVLARLRAGSRPQEVAEARAGLQASQAALDNARTLWERQRGLVDSGFLPRQDLDNATEALRAARAGRERAAQALSLARQGPRREDVAAAAAEVRADEASVALAQRQLDDATLHAPEDAVVENRILEVGDMASPQAPVLTLALREPLWVRAYVPERELGRVAPGMHARIYSDSFPGQAFAGWIGFISPTAEFTPRQVQTSELRTQLVYRMRVYACGGEERLRLGMPVTVRVPLRDNPAGAASDACRP